MVRASIYLLFQQLLTKHVLFSRQHTKNWDEKRYDLVKDAAITQLNKHLNYTIVSCDNTVN